MSNNIDTLSNWPDRFAVLETIGQHLTTAQKITALNVPIRAFKKAEQDRLSGLIQPTPNFDCSPYIERFSNPREVASAPEPKLGNIKRAILGVPFAPTDALLFAALYDISPVLLRQLNKFAAQYGIDDIQIHTKTNKATSSLEIWKTSKI
jgi:hypothetical protein